MTFTQFSPWAQLYHYECNIPPNLKEKLNANVTQIAVSYQLRKQCIIEHETLSLLKHHNVLRIK